MIYGINEAEEEEFHVCYINETDYQQSLFYERQECSAKTQEEWENTCNKLITDGIALSSPSQIRSSWTTIHCLKQYNISSIIAETQMLLFCILRTEDEI